MDDQRRADAYARLLTSDEPYGNLGVEEQRLARMLVFSAWSGGGVESYDKGLRQLRSEPAFVDDLIAVTSLGVDRSRHVPTALQGRLADVPLQVHARYQREEILAALDYATLSRTPRSVMQGVVYSKDLDTDILFVTLRKSEADYSPTTMYQDYPISPNLFHWESQSTTTLVSPTGRRYTAGDGSILLFVRHEKVGEFGTNHYLFLGPVQHVSHQGEKPISITWRLEPPMPSDFFASASVAVS